MFFRFLRIDVSYKIQIVSLNFHHSSKNSLCTSIFFMIFVFKSSANSFLMTVTILEKPKVEEKNYTATKYNTYEYQKSIISASLNHCFGFYIHVVQYEQNSLFMVRLRENILHIHKKEYRRSQRLCSRRI